MVDRQRIVTDFKHHSAFKMYNILVYLNILSLFGSVQTSDPI